MAPLGLASKITNAGIVGVNLWRIRNGSPSTLTGQQCLIVRLLLEKIPLAGIARAMQVFESWLQRYVNQAYQALGQRVQVKPKSKGQQMVQMDQLWSFVDHKGSKQWIWLALGAMSREIVGCFMGERSQDPAQALWDSLPAVYRHCAVIYTDDWAADKSVLPSKRHRVVGKETGLTSDIERFNNTFRQRVSRLGRKTLSFSKSLENHIGAIWNFIHHYNAQLQLEAVG